jgi:hypothetical protein
MIWVLVVELVGIVVVIPWEVVVGAEVYLALPACGALCIIKTQTDAQCI